MNKQWLRTTIAPKSCAFIGAVFLCVATWFGSSESQDRKLERIRIGGGGVGAPQMTMWFAKEANLYEKHGLAVEAIHIPGSFRFASHPRKNPTQSTNGKA
jgi:hypothetical protein